MAQRFVRVFMIQWWEEGHGWSGQRICYWNEQSALRAARKARKVYPGAMVVDYMVVGKGPK